VPDVLDSAKIFALGKDLGCVWFGCEMWKSCCGKAAVRKLLWKSWTPFGSICCETVNCCKMSVMPLRSWYAVYICKMSVMM
jgi:hypothetical protein